MPVAATRMHRQRSEPASIRIASLAHEALGCELGRQGPLPLRPPRCDHGDKVVSRNATASPSGHGPLSESCDIAEGPSVGNYVGDVQFGSRGHVPRLLAHTATHRKRCFRKSAHPLNFRAPGMANISDHQQTRLRALQHLVIDIGRKNFDERYVI